MIFGLVFLIIVFSFGLIKSTELVATGLKHLSRGTKSSMFALSAILLALSTSFPELSIGITAALEGSPNLSLGNILGANIANISLVTGLAALIAGRVTIHGGYLKRDLGLALLAGIAPLFLALDGAISRVDGLILLFVYAGYATSFFKFRFNEIAARHLEEEVAHRFMTIISGVNGSKTKQMGRLFIGIALLLFSANMIVRFGSQLAEIANIPVFLVGLILVSIGTTLPELAFSVRSLEDREPRMFFGNILGSIIANSTLIMGVVTVISPVKIVALADYSTAAIFFVIAFFLYWFFIRTKHRIERWEAGILLLVYAVFVAIGFF